MRRADDRIRIMFGYVVVNKPELKIREFEEYKAHYCGLCHILRKKYGLIAGFTLTYDMTFLILLLDSLYETHRKVMKKHCPIHPVKKQPMIRNEITEYAADMNILLAWGHFVDDWADEKKLSALLGDKAFARRARFVEKRYPRQTEVVLESLARQSRLEKEYLYRWRDLEQSDDWDVKIGGESCTEVTADLDVISRPFGELLGEVFVWRDDAFAPILRRLGFFIGKAIYIRDSLDDVEKDRKNGCFNPFLYGSMDPESEKRIRSVLDLTIRSAIIELEKLPLDRHITILRNILYEGIQGKKRGDKKHVQ